MQQFGEVAFLSGIVSIQTTSTVFVRQHSPIPTKRQLHLKTAMDSLDPGAVIVSDPFFVIPPVHLKGHETYLELILYFPMDLEILDKIKSPSLCKRIWKE